jgi:SAM-dependent methyltransferase
MSEERADLVLWPNPTTSLLVAAAMRRSSRATLDLGSGGGVLAMLTRAFSERVVATDINQRCREFAEFNFQLNELEIEYRVGDSFAPVEGEKFDLIVSNPPFFITPVSQFVYCDNPLELDGFCRRLAKEAPAYLEEGGFYQMLCEWAEVEGEPWRDRLAEWFDGSGCDVWVIRGTETGAADYASDRFFELSPGATMEKSGEYNRWMDYYRSQKLKSVHAGLVTMRKRSTSPNWVRIDESMRSRAELSIALDQAFAVRDELDRTGREDLFRWRLRVAPATRLTRRSGVGPEGWLAGDLTLEKLDGLKTLVPVQELVAEFVGRFGDGKELGAVIGELAAEVDAPREQVEKEGEAIARRMLEGLFLERVPAAADAGS